MHRYPIRRSPGIYAWGVVTETHPAAYRRRAPARGHLILLRDRFLSMGVVTSRGGSGGGCREGVLAPPWGGVAYHA